MAGFCRWQESPVVLLDDVDFGDGTLYEKIGQLIRIAGSIRPNMTVILTTSLPTLPTDIAARIDLRTQILPFLRQETGRYLHSRLAESRVGTRLSFTEEAIDTLQEITGGVPAAIKSPGRPGHCGGIRARSEESFRRVRALCRRRSNGLARSHTPRWRREAGEPSRGMKRDLRASV